MKKFILYIALTFFLIAPAHARFLSGGSNSPVLPILDTVACTATSGAGYGTVKLRTAYGGNAFQMRVKQSGTYVYQDIGFNGLVANYSAADTFAATADSGTPAELRFYDQCGNSNDTTFSVTAGVKGALWSPYSLGTTNLRSASFDTLYDNSTLSVQQELLMPSTVAMNMDAFSAVFIGRRGTVYPAHPTSYWEFLNTAPWHSDWYDYDTDSGNNILESSGTKLNYGTVETGNGVYINIFNSSAAVLLANELSSSQSKSALSATANNGGVIGNTLISGTYDGGQDIVAQIFYNRTLTSLEQSNVDAYGYSLLGPVENIQDCAVVIGDSLSQSYVAGWNEGWVNQAINGVATPFSKPFRIYNSSTNGGTAATFLSNISRYTSACSNSSVTKKIALVMAGTNDIGNGVSPSTVANTLYSIWTDMHNAGFKVVCATIPNNAEGNSGNIPTFNGLISANYAANHCDALADNWANPNIGNGSNTGNTTYFYTDGIHLSITGYGIVGQNFANAANTVD